MSVLRRIFLASAAALAAAALPAAGEAPKAAGDAFREAHAAEAAKIMGEKGAHAPALRGECSACHASPAEPKKLKAEVPALCLGCHEALKGAFKKKTVHKPLEDCGGCHSPHSSEQPALLSEAVNGLCASCHDPEDAELRGKHFGLVPRRAECTACHSPHASDEKHLFLEGVTHDPFPECKECHLEAGREGRLRLKPIPGTCFSCHDGMEAALEKARVVHKPVAKGGCTECHWPHVTAGPGLLVRKSVNATCRQCHKQIPEEGHPVVFHKTGIPGKPNPLDPSKPFSCVSCHEPHASEHAALRSADPKAFCTVCHEK